ncbi:hypothetical protein B0H13DRAFT_1895485 [Mycena leptocephala]|nr:hypothetical protein B0H13DRAFT_1895485 [Mycena leptocephala]
MDPRLESHTLRRFNLTLLRSDFFASTYRYEFRCISDSASSDLHGLWSNIGLGPAPAIHLPRMNPAHLILAVHDIKKRNATNNDNKYNITVTRFIERANTTLERLDGAILNAGINTTKIPPPHPGHPRLRDGIARKILETE